MERLERIRARADAPAQATLMLEELERRETGAAAAIRDDPLSWVGAWSEVELAERDALPSGSAAGCDVDGSYDPSSSPPRIVVRRSSRERMQFTALHELGHHLQQTSHELAGALAVREDVGVALEEAAADQFAARVVIPDDDAYRILGTGTPSAQAVADLWRALPHASRQAVAVRAVLNLETDGHVLLLNSEGAVEFCRSRGAFALARGSDQTSTEIWSRIVAAPPATVTARGRFAYRGLLGGDAMYAQAAPAGTGHHFVVAATERVPWQLSIHAPEFNEYGVWHTCERSGCSHVFLATAKCEVCEEPRCPECDWCACKASRLAEFTCSECWCVRSPKERSTTPGVCTECV